LDLKKQIEIERNIRATSSSVLYYMGCPIREEDALLADYFNLGNTIFELVKTNDEDTARQQKDHPRWILSEQSAHLITGQPRKFQYLRVIPNRPIKFKPQSKKFGVVYEKEGVEIGKRLLHVEVYEIKKAGKIELRGSTEEDKIRVFLIKDGTEEELFGVIQTFDESMNNQRGNLPKKIAGLITALGSMVFEGTSNFIDFRVFTCYFQWW
jgi:hypothetical protein